MLQISQTENPICSATIDQMRLRRAMTLPLEFQNASSSGSQSEIQVGSCLCIRCFLSTVVGFEPRGTEARAGKVPVGRSQNSDGRHQWRQREASQASCQAI